MRPRAVFCFSLVIADQPGGHSSAGALCSRPCLARQSADAVCEDGFDARRSPLGVAEPQAQGRARRGGAKYVQTHAPGLLPAPPAQKRCTTPAGGACHGHARRHAGLGGRRRRVVQLAYAAAAHLARAIQHQPVGHERRQQRAASAGTALRASGLRRAPRVTIVAHASPGGDRKRRRSGSSSPRSWCLGSTAATPSSRSGTAVGAPPPDRASRRPSLACDSAARRDAVNFEEAARQHEVGGEQRREEEDRRADEAQRRKSRLHRRWPAASAVCSRRRRRRRRMVWSVACRAAAADDGEHGGARRGGGGG